MTTQNDLTLPPVPDAPLRTYRLAPPETSQRSVFGLAARFGLEGDLDHGSLLQDARQMTYRERTFELTVFPGSGCLRYCDMSRWQVDDGESEVTFDDDEATRMAKQVVDELSLAPPNEYRLLQVSRLHVAVADKTSGHAEHRVIDIGVAFQRVIDGVSFEGPGGKIIVYLDHNGRYTGFDKFWREIQDVHEADIELRPPAVVLAEVVQAEGAAAGGGSQITVNDFRLSYFERHWYEPQSFLQPAYAMNLTVAVPGGCEPEPIKVLSQVFVAAAAQPPEALALNPQPLPPHPQPERK